jgi:AraC-like DNA-binding protein
LSTKRQGFPFKFYGRWVRYDWARVEDRLGKETDRSIAKKLGCTSVAVGYMRERLNIPRYRLADALRPLLGQYPDEMVAEMHGVHKRTVAKHRRAEGIKPCNRIQMMRLQRARREAEQEAKQEETP